jgi:phosphomannomutase
MQYKNGKVDTLDGLSIEFPDWRFNLRASNTEPVIRLNVETRGNRTLLEEKTQELLQEIGGEPA